MSRDALPILIVGGGPAGLAAALALAQNGVTARIVDKAIMFHESSRGSGLQPRTIEMLRFLGVLDDVLALAQPILPLRTYKLPGGTEPIRTINLFDSFKVSPDRPHTMMALSQYIHEGILRDHLSKYGVHVELGTEPLSMEQNADGVTVTLKKAGSDGVETLETVHVAYVVGADGARGVTRKMIGATFEGQTIDADGQTWADVIADGLTPDYCHMWSEPGKFTISMRPKGFPDAYHFAVVGHDFDPVDLTDAEALVNFFHENTGRTDIVFKKVAALTYWKPKVRMVNKLYDGRIFLIGDAAHVHPPSGGQGLNTSVQDAINLSWKLALVHKRFASPELLSTYEIERLPVIAHMLKATASLYARLTTKKTKDGPSSTEPREDKDKTTSTSGGSAWRDNTLHQLEINYRWSPILVDAHHTSALTADEMKARAYEGYPGEGVAAGDRAPNVAALIDSTSGRETALFDVFKPYVHTVVVFVPTGADADVRREVQAVVAAVRLAPEGTMQILVIGGTAVGEVLEGVVWYRDPDHVANQTYGVDGGRLTVVVVRPDAYVGAVVYDAGGVRDYLSRVFEHL